MSAQSPDFTSMRRTMVDCQVRPADVTDLRVIDAMLAVPRELFLPAAQRGMAYLDLDVGIGAASSQRYVLKPALIARMLQAAGITPTHRVLVVGCATGYLPALVSRLAAEVTALETDSDRAAEASATLVMAGYANITVVTGKLADGVTANAPYDAIILAGATEIAPEMLYRQLTPTGCLVGVFGPMPQRAMLVRHSHDGFGSRVLFDATAPVLPGLERPAAFAF